MERLIFPTEFKAISDEGHVSGWASVYGNTDLQNDIVMAGAFKSASGSKVPMLWQHRADSPLGVAMVSEDAKGLRFDASLVMSDPLAVKARDHMRAGSVRGVSVGFDINKGGSRVRDDGVRLLTDLALWEVSICTFGANPLATVTAVKSREEIEQAVRAEWGWSKSKARKMAHMGWKIYNGDEPDDEIAPDLQRELARILNTNSQLKGN